jgi:hypothetical protein
MKEFPSIEREVKMSAGRRSKRPIERILVFLFMQLNGHLISNLVEIWPGFAFYYGSVGSAAFRHQFDPCSTSAQLVTATAQF